MPLWERQEYGRQRAPFMLVTSLPYGPLRIICLGAHCDDIEIGAGGTVLSLLRSHPGSSVRWVAFSGDKTRQDEARASAADFLDAAASKEITFHDFPEGYFPHVGASIKDAFERLKASAEADVILTHYKKDDHQDHRTLADLTWNTWRNHFIMEYEIPKYEDDIGSPSVFRVIPRDLADRKVGALMRCFRSQMTRAWFSEDTFWAWMRMRGVQCASPSGLAEAFHVRKLQIA